MSTNQSLFSEALAESLKADGEPAKRMIGLIGATVEVIAACRAVGLRSIEAKDRGPLIDGLRQLGACSYQLAAEIEEKKGGS